MELLIATLLVAYAEKDQTFKETLSRILSFYRENRALLVALSGKEGENEDERTPRDKKISAAGDGEKILEELLKKI